MKKCNCNGTYDHAPNGSCLMVEYNNAMESRFDRSEALAHMSQAEKEEEIRYINKQNKEKVAKNIQQENNWQF